jgi:hypothetical protein
MDGQPSQNGVNDPAITFDGANYVVLAPQHKGGIWRYVEPADPTETVLSHEGAARVTGIAVVATNGTLTVDTPAGTAWELEIFTLDGELVTRRQGSGMTAVALGRHVSAAFALARLRAAVETVVEKVHIW